MKSYVNLGCGRRCHPDWTNFDIAPQRPGVIRADLSRGIPLPSDSVEVVYHSAVLEHIRREHVPGFLGECHRVLRPGGIIRVAVPDFERLCRAYLQKLEAAMDRAPGAAADYDWLMLEILDQAVRERSGGEMLAYLARQEISNEDYVYERIGDEGRDLVAATRSAGTRKRPPLDFPLLWRYSGRLISAGRRFCAGLFLTGIERTGLRIGCYRLGGEVHQWMYDRYSLALALRRVGFVQPRLQQADTSLIPGWAGFGLDTGAGGRAIKPDLFYMEAVKAPAE